MEEIANIGVLFIAGFGPIVRDAAASRKLYTEVFEIPFKEETGGYLDTEGLDGAKTFALWPLAEAAQSCYGKDSWPSDIPVPQAWIEFDVEDVEKATAEPRITRVSNGQKQKGAVGSDCQPLHRAGRIIDRDHLHPHRCEKRNSAIRS